MKYRVEVTETAWAEVEEAYNWLANHSPQAATRWKKALLNAVDSLEAMPDRCHLAPESTTWKREIRELLHGRGRASIGSCSKFARIQFMFCEFDTARCVCLRTNE
jgi:plasmid stabilization system protein ParE